MPVGWAWVDAWQESVCRRFDVLAAEVLHHMASSIVLALVPCCFIRLSDRKLTFAYTVRQLLWRWLAQAPQSAEGLRSSSPKATLFSWKSCHVLRKAHEVSIRIP